MAHSTWRIGCVRLPRFPLGAVWGAGAWDITPCALETSGRIRVVSLAAGRHGVRTGMTVAAATALCHDLVVRPWDDVALRRATEAVTTALLTATPQVTPAAPGLWWVGADGFDGLGGEPALVQALLAVASRWHAEARVAIAGSCLAARVATFASEEPGSPPGLGRGRTRIIPAGQDADYLALAPLALLPLERELREAFTALGLRTIGAVAALDPMEVEQRWGEAGLAAWRLARGDDPRRPQLVRVAPPPTVAAELPVPAATLEPVLFLVKAAIDRLVATLHAQGRAVQAFTIALTVDDACGALPTAAAGTTLVREVVSAQPLARSAPLLELARAALEGVALEAPALAVTVTITREVPLPAEQGDLLHRGWRDPAAAAAAFARLRATLGPGAVVVPELRDTHRPEASGAWVEVEGARAVARATGGGAARRPGDHEPTERARVPAGIACRLLDPAEPIEVEPDGFRWREARYAVRGRTGPERLSGEWWQGGYARDYWRWTAVRERGVRYAGSGGGAGGGGSEAEFLVYRDLHAGMWRVQGWYD